MSFSLIGFGAKLIKPPVYLKDLALVLLQADSPKNEMKLKISKHTQAEEKASLILTHSHIFLQSASSQCGKRGCHPKRRGHRQTLLVDSKLAGVCL